MLIFTSVLIFSRYTPVPDSIILGSRDLGYSNEVQGSGLETPMTDFKQIGDARKGHLGSKLDSLGTMTTSISSVDATGYITELDSMTSSLINGPNVNDTKKAISLFQSLVKTDPGNSSGWVSLVRMLRENGQSKEARQVILEGCKACPKSEQIWLEAVRLYPQKAAEILRKALENVPGSVKLWLQLIELAGTSIDEKIGILQESIQSIPSSVQLWTKLISLHEEALMGASNSGTSSLQSKSVLLALLNQALQCIPTHAPFWIQLAFLEGTQEMSRKILNKARTQCPTEVSIWIAAAQLEERHCNISIIPNLLSRAVSTLLSKGVAATTTLGRSFWLAKGKGCEEEYPACSEAMLRLAFRIEGKAEKEERLQDFQDIQEAIQEGHFISARFMIRFILELEPTCMQAWTFWIDLEKQHGTPSIVGEIFDRALNIISEERDLWIQVIHYYWKDLEDLEGARKYAYRARTFLPLDEDLFLLLVDLEIASNNCDSTSNEMLNIPVVKELFETVPIKTPKVSLRLALIYNTLFKDTLAARQVLESAILQFPKASILYITLGRLFENAINNISSSNARDGTSLARQIYTEGCRQCPTSIRLWELSACLEERVSSNNSAVKARAIYESASKLNPHSDTLIVSAALLEMRCGNIALAKSKLSRGLSTFPKSGILWSTCILLEPRHGQKNKAMLALKTCPHDALVLATIGRLFHRTMEVDGEKAKQYFEKAIKLDPKNGDIWAYYLKTTLTSNMEDAINYDGSINKDHDASVDKNHDMSANDITPINVPTCTMTSDWSSLMNRFFKNLPMERGEVWLSFAIEDPLNFNKDPTLIMEQVIKHLG